MADDSSDLVEQSAEMAKEMAETSAAYAVVAIKALGDSLLSLLRDIDLEETAKTALSEMRDKGVKPGAEVLQSIGSEVKSAIASVDGDMLQSIQKTAGDAATLLGHEFMKFWDALQGSISELIEQGSDMSRMELPSLEVATAAIAEKTKDIASSVADISTEIGEDASKLANDAAEFARGVGAEMAKEAADVLQDTAKDLANAAGDLADISGDVVDAARDGAEAAVDVVKTLDIYNADITQGVIGAGFEGLESAYTDSREAVHNAIQALSGVAVGGCATLCPLLRFEILRDTCQTISIFFNDLFADVKNTILVDVKAFFGGLYNLIAVDLASSLQSDAAVEIGIIILLILSAVMLVFYAWFAMSAAHVHSREKEIREGHETKTWAQVAADQKWKIKITTYIITICISLHLPLTRLSLQVLLKDETSLVHRHFGDENTSTLYQIIQIVSVIILLAFSIPLPILLYLLINRNKPAGSVEDPTVTYDMDGEKIEFTDKVYHRMVAQNPDQVKCPYRSLYNGFESRWAWFKVYKMAVKVCLLLPAALLAGQSRGFALLAINATSTFFTLYSTPFIDRVNDVMGISGHSTELITCFSGVLALLASTTSIVAGSAGVLVGLSNLFNGLIMVACFAFGMKSTRLMIKNLRGSFTFSDTVLDIEGNSGCRIVPDWDLDREAKHRIWHAFWEGIVLNFCGEDAALRLVELKEATVSSGIENIRKHWEGEKDATISKARMHCRQSLEGMDVYWDDATGCRDGKLDSKTFFGKMYVHPYPFHCVVVYDDAKDESIIRDEKFMQFYAKNTSPEILAKRAVRQKLRCLSSWGGKVRKPFSRQETESVADGTKTVQYEDSEGQSHTREETNYSTVTFTCYYTEGVINVSANTKKQMADGFQVSMTYTDGHGEARLPNTGQMHQFHNRTATMGASHIGLNDDMNETQELRSIFNDTSSILSLEMPKLLEEHNTYRQQLIQKFDDKNKTLGSGFWYYVFNNENLTRDELLRYLDTSETNSVLKDIPKRHTAALDFVYKRIAFISLNRAIKLWYIFWDDFYSQNKDMKCVIPHLNDFDPNNGSSICYRVLKREDLVTWLQEKNLFGLDPTPMSTILFKKQYFNNRLLDTLYQRIENERNPVNISIKIAS